MKNDTVNDLGLLLIVFLLGGVVFSRFVEVKDANGNTFGCGVKIENVRAK